MSVTHKKSEKQIGAAELEALRASIMAEVEAARAETEESIISSIRNNLVSLPKIFVNLLSRRGCYFHSIWMDQSDCFSVS